MADKKNALPVAAKPQEMIESDNVDIRSMIHACCNNGLIRPAVLISACI